MKGLWDGGKRKQDWVWWRKQTNIVMMSPGRSRNETTVCSETFAFFFNGPSASTVSSRFFKSWLSVVQLREGSHFRWHCAGFSWRLRCFFHFDSSIQKNDDVIQFRKNCQLFFFPSKKTNKQVIFFFKLQSRMKSHFCSLSFFFLSIFVDFYFGLFLLLFWPIFFLVVLVLAFFKNS